MSDEYTLIPNIDDKIVGKTIRQINSEKQHMIPIGSIVKVLHFDFESEKYVDKPECLVLRVLRHIRDCDETSLYSLGHQTMDEYQAGVEFKTMSLTRYKDIEIQGSVGSCIRVCSSDDAFNQEYA